MSDDLWVLKEGGGRIFTAAQIRECIFERKAPLATISCKKWVVGLFSKVDLFSGDYGNAE